MTRQDPSALSLVELLQRAQQLRDDSDDAYADGGHIPLRLAILGTYTTSFVCRLLEPFFHHMGFRITLHEAPFNTLEQGILDPTSELRVFRPQVTVLMSYSGHLRECPPLFASHDEVEHSAAAEVAHWAQLWQAIAEAWGGATIQTNFEPPIARPLGQLEARYPFSRQHFAQAVNRQLAAIAPSGVSLFDQAGLVSEVGVRRALDEGQMAATQQPWSFAFLPTFCHALSCWVAAHAGRTRKCLVLDLDDTLWGGTVAEDGLDRLRLGPGDAEGEAFVSFQRYALALKQRGVLLAVNSKNDEDNARAPFKEHPHMVLQEDDIACFVANWQDKASNLRRIAGALNLGLDSFVFVDNSAEERHLVRSALPEVAVVELPDDPSGYVQALQAGHHFEVPSLTSDAARRTEYMRADAARGQAQASFTDYKTYLDSLQMRGRVETLTDANLDRAAELVQRTNQFNLRTARHSAAHLRHLATAKGAFVVCGYLRDRFGDHGMISVIAAEQRDDVLFIDTWLMSCRALKKTFEHFMMAEVIARARAMGMQAIEGEYLPTAKNAMVADHYARFGFSALTGAPGQAGTRFRLRLDDRAVAPEHHISREESDG